MSQRAQSRLRTKRAFQRCMVDALESRVLMSTTTLRIANYNIEDDINGATTPLPGLYAVLEAMGSYSIGGVSQPLDILGLEETTSNATTIAPIVTNLNSYYGAGTYAQSTYQGTQDGSDADGNGPNGIVYNTKTLQLLASVGVGTPEGSTNGYYRQVVRYEFETVGGTAANAFYVYVMHPKSGGTSGDQTDRNDEAVIVRDDEKTLPSTARVIYMGDFNLGSSTEASYQTFAGSGQGQGNDPINMPGDWQDNSAFAGILSDADTDLNYRDDLQLVTSNVLTDNTGLYYVNGSYQAFGNNGSVAVGKSVNSSSNTALAGLSNRTTILTDLTTASDHLPILADYTIPTGTVAGTPAIGSFAISPASVTTGGAFTLTASNVAETGGTISGVKFYEETNGTAGFQTTDTLVGSGTESGTTWSLSATAPGSTGTYTYYAVATDSAGVGSNASSAALAVTSSGAGGTNTSGALLTWNVAGQSAFGTQGLAATTVATGNSNSLGLTRGSGVSTSGTGAANGWGGSNWSSTSAAGITGNETVTFGLTVSSGYTESLSTINLNYRRSSTGPTSGYWQCEIGSGAWTLISDVGNEFSSTSTSGAAMTALGLTGVGALQGLAAGTAVKFRLTPYGSTGSSGTWYVYDGSGKDLVVSGSTAATPGAISAQAPGLTATADAMAATPPLSVDDVEETDWRHRSYFVG